MLDEYNANYIDNIKLDRKPIIKKLIAYGVKIVNCKRRIQEHEIMTKEDAEYDFNFIEIVKSLMGMLTPKEIMQMYPITKEYDGHKYDTKDYFYTINYINKLDQNSPVGANILDLLWEYQNRELRIFNVETLSSIDRLRKFQGEPSLMEEFAGTMGIKTYKMYTDNKGKKFLFDKENGKTIKVKNPKLNFLRLIK